MGKKTGRPGPDPGTGGRPKKHITQKLVDKLCQMQCTRDEICAFFEIDQKTIESRIKEWTNDQDMTFSSYFKQKREGGKASLRRKQWLMADKNPAMAIFLGKQYLGQKDINHIEAKHDIMTMDIKLTPEDEKAFDERLAGFLGLDYEEIKKFERNEKGEDK